MVKNTTQEQYALELKEDLLVYNYHYVQED
jgi:hypothetical protein